MTTSTGRAAGHLRWAAILALALVFVLAPAAAAAEHESAGCDTLNLPDFDAWGPVTAFSFNGLQMSEGEVVTIEIGDPSNTSADDIVLRYHTGDFSYTEIGRTSFPGTISWQIPVDGTYGFFAELDPATGDATFNWGCTPAATTPDFCADGRTFGEFHSSQAKDTGLTHKPGSHYGFASCIHGTDFNDGKKLGPKG